VSHALADAGLRDSYREVVVAIDQRRGIEQLEGVLEVGIEGRIGHAPDPRA
jgi:hypothetical protein